MREDNVVEVVSEAYAALNTTRTPAVRKMSHVLFKTIEHNDKAMILGCCEALLKERKYPYWIVAYAFLLKMKKKVTAEDFQRYDLFVRRYVRDWVDCDDFATHALGEMLVRHPHLFPEVKRWVNDEHFAVRRCAAVALILGVKRKVVPLSLVFEVASQLMHDEHYLVQKGYGWLLKITSQVEREAVIGFVETHKSQMPRVALRYAIEKLPEETRMRLMA